jgi:hypothetical protein
MYVIPLVFIVLIAMAIFFSPIVAVILLVVALLGIGAVKYFGGDTVDPESTAPPTATAAEAPGKHFTKDPDPGGTHTGLWGERRPD